MHRLMSILLSTVFALSIWLSMAQINLLAEEDEGVLDSYAETIASEPYLEKGRPEDALDPDPELQERIDEFFQSRDYLEDNISYSFEDLYGNPLAEHNSELPQVAASTVKIYTALWIARAVDLGDINWDDPVTYYADLDFEGGTGSLQTWITSGESLTIEELLTLMIEESDNIAFHMLDRHFATTYGGQIATFYFSERFELALDYSNNILSPEDLIFAYRLIYKHREKDSFAKLIDILKTSEGPTVFPDEDISHKPGDYGSASADAGILWRDQGPIFYAVLLHDSGDHTETLEELGDLVLETVEKKEAEELERLKELEGLEGADESEEQETVSTIFVPAK